jgi:hypothetical protein
MTSMEDREPAPAAGTRPIRPRRSALYMPGANARALEKGRSLAADVLIMPSPYESLSMVTLEAWAMGRPVLVNGDCDVLRGQAVRSNAGLYYTSYAEFAETLRLLENDPRLRAGLGANGRRYFERHYTWPEIDRKYLDLLDRLRQEDGAAGGRAMEPMPGWRGRRRRNLPPAAEVVDRAPRGPVAPAESRDG